MKSNTFELRLIEHNSNEYWNLVSLRDKVLRKPLGLEFTNEELLAENDQLHFGGYENDELVGCFAFVKKTDSILKMRQVAVDPIFQGRGVGSKMVVASEKWAIENGYSKIELHARLAATKFYSKLGYQIIGSEFLEVGIPHYKMKKAL